MEAPSPSNVSALAGFSAKMDGAPKPTKLAIVAADNLLFGLGRMYQAYREMKPGSTKEVAVFRSMPDALAWLGPRSALRSAGWPDFSRAILMWTNARVEGLI